MVDLLLQGLKPEIEKGAHRGEYQHAAAIHNELQGAPEMEVVPIAEDVVGEKVGDTEQDKGPDAPKDDPLVIDAPEDQRPQHEFVERAETEGDTSKQEHHF